MAVGSGRLKGDLVTTFESGNLDAGSLPPTSHKHFGLEGNLGQDLGQAAPKF